MVLLYRIVASLNVSFFTIVHKESEVFVKCCLVRISKRTKVSNPIKGSLTTPSLYLVYGVQQVTGSKQFHSTSYLYRKIMKGVFPHTSECFKLFSFCNPCKVGCWRLVLALSLMSY